MTKTLFAAAAAALAAFGTPAHAVVSLNAASDVYTQSFDTLAAATSSSNVAWANDSTLAGWFLFNRANGTAASTYRGDNGGSNTGYFYSYGTTGASDRALGSIGSSSSSGYWGTVSSGTVAGYIALAVKNNTGAALDSFQLQFDGEQWRDGGNNPAVAQAMTVQYGFGDAFNTVASWTSLSALTFSSPTFTTTGKALNGNATANRVAGLSAQVQTPAWSQGSTLWVRWAEVNDNGSDHGLAIDNVQLSVTAVPEPGSYALMLAGLAGIGALLRRRSA